MLQEKDGNYFRYHDAIGVRNCHLLPEVPSATSFRVWHVNKMFNQYNFIANDSETVKKWMRSILFVLNMLESKGKR